MAKSASWAKRNLENPANPINPNSDKDAKSRLAGRCFRRSGFSRRRYPFAAAESAPAPPRQWRAPPPPPVQSQSQRARSRIPRPQFRRFFRALTGATGGRALHPPPPKTFGTPSQPARARRFWRASESGYFRAWARKSESRRARRLASAYFRATARKSASRQARRSGRATAREWRSETAWKSPLGYFRAWARKSELRRARRSATAYFRASA